MTAPKFAIGQTVRFSPDRHQISSARGQFKVVRLLPEDASVQEVANAMVTGRIHRVLVTRAKKMVGIISSLDLLPLVRDM